VLSEDPPDNFGFLPSEFRRALLSTDACCRRVDVSDANVGVWLLTEVNLKGGMPIWSLSMSPDAKFVAAGCQDGTLRVWSTNLQQQTAGDSLSVLSSDDGCSDYLVNAHDATIVFVIWEPRKNAARLMSAGLDHTIRIWEAPVYTSKTSTSKTSTSKTSSSSCLSLECLAVIRCSDWPTSAAFHPSIRRRVLVGSLDATVQVWDVKIQQNDVCTGGNTPIRNENRKNSPEKLPRKKKSNLAGKDAAAIKKYLDTEDLVTALAISENGQLVAVGLRCARVSIYETQTLKFVTQIDCKNRRGKLRHGRKVTGLQWVDSDRSICVTTNDSRIRIVCLNDFSMLRKFKGHLNNQIMLQAALTGDGKTLVCGSETGSIHIWNSKNEEPPNLRHGFNEVKRQTNSNSICFRAFNEVVTSCVLAPEAFTRPWHERIHAVHSADESRSDDTKTQFHVVLCASYRGSIKVFVVIRSGEGQN